MNNCYPYSEYSIELRHIKPVFDFEYDFYDEHFRCDFEQKFIDHYYFHEIGFETVDRFKHMLKAHLNLKMPYYAQLYETELAAEELDFLLNKDYRETFLREVDTEDRLIGSSDTNKVNGTTATANTNSTNDRKVNNKTSEIQDGVANVNLQPEYLTNVSSSDDSTKFGSNTSNRVDENGNISERNNEDKTGKLMEKTELVGKGNIGVTSSAELLEKWRNVLINLDEKIILECRDLFMGVY